MIWRKKDFGQLYAGKSYEEATFPQRFVNGSNAPKDLERLLDAEKRRAFIVVDMQATYLMNIPQDKRDKMVDAQKEVLHYCAEGGVPTVFLEMEHAGETFLELKAAAGDENRTIIKKPHPSGFVNTCLESFLEVMRIKEMYFMGIYSTGCVRLTALGAKRAGFDVITAERLIANPRGLDDRKAFERMGVYLT